MIRKYKYILFFFICFLFSDNDDIGFSEESSSKNDIVTIIATANVKGEVDPCG